MGWLARWKARRAGSARAGVELTPEHDPVVYHPAHEGETPQDLHRGRRRLKETFTNHWDLDYLPREELDKLAAKQKKTD